MICRVLGDVLGALMHGFSLGPIRGFDTLREQHMLLDIPAAISPRADDVDQDETDEATS